MKTRATLFWAGLAGAMALGTFVLGWWAVPIAGGIWGGARRVARPGLSAAAAGAAAWATLLSATALQGPFDELAAAVAGVFSAPGFALVLLTLIFSALWAGSAAAFVGALRSALERGASSSSAGEGVSG